MATVSFSGSLACVCMRLGDSGSLGSFFKPFPESLTLSATHCALFLRELLICGADVLCGVEGG